ncbi:MAG: hypothetical protein FJW34_09450, partial [Acidobacteria bacterium]|nr:hypothetical protein [Acidobacteriota bacterium]
MTALEVGRTTLEEWYKALEAPILVSEELTLSVPGGYRQKGDKWEAYVTSIPAEWLYDLYVNHGSEIFSPNLRGYLGSRQSDTNINHGIKTSAQSDPLNF